MEYFSLKRSTTADRGQANLSSKVYVRSTKSGKVQKIVRELYLRQDIPCSSNLCRACLEIAPTDYSKKGEVFDVLSRLKLTPNSRPICALRYPRRIQAFP
jgi:exosome complex exonuclease DIS3/RRP44